MYNLVGFEAWDSGQKGTFTSLRYFLLTICFDIIRPPDDFIFFFPFLIIIKWIIDKDWFSIMLYCTRILLTRTFLKVILTFFFFCVCGTFSTIVENYKKNSFEVYFCSQRKTLLSMNNLSISVASVKVPFSPLKW